MREVNKLRVDTSAVLLLTPLQLAYKSFTVDQRALMSGWRGVVRRPGIDAARARGGRDRRADATGATHHSWRTQGQLVGPGDQQRRAGQEEGATRGALPHSTDEFHHLLRL